MREITVLHAGTLRFWGEWFGRPMDNCHIPVTTACDGIANTITITFDGGGTCTVSAPSGIVSTERTFYVREAKSILWTWYSYGGKPVKENRFQLRYTREGTGSVIRQKEDFYHAPVVTHICPRGFHAVEIC